MTVWLEFAACALIILFAGTRLTYYGDIISEKLGLGRTWVGIALMASVTSLPELITGISSVTLAGVPDIAAGDALGSCTFNILIVALLDLMSGRTAVSTRVHQGHVLTASLGIFLLGLVTISLYLGPRMPSIGWVGWNSVILLALYLGAMKMVWTYERRRVAELVELTETQYGDVSSLRAGMMYAINAVLIIAAAAYLPYLGEEIARITNLGQSFVGNVVIAASTSLPEIVVSVAAFRMGAVDMAFGNLFGSNLFDIAIIGIDDVFYTKGVLLSHVSSVHTIAAVGAMTMTAVAVVGLTYRVGKKRVLLAWDSWGIVSVYALVTMTLYLSR